MASRTGCSRCGNSSGCECNVGWRLIAQTLEYPSEMGSALVVELRGFLFDSSEDRLLLKVGGECGQLFLVGGNRSVQLIISGHNQTKA